MSTPELKLSDKSSGCKHLTCW